MDKSRGRVRTLGARTAVSDRRSSVGGPLLILALRAFVWVIWVHLHDGSAFRFAPGSSSAPSTVDILRPEARTLAAG